MLATRRFVVTKATKSGSLPALGKLSPHAEVAIRLPRSRYIPARPALGPLPDTDLTYSRRARDSTA